MHARAREREMEDGKEGGREEGRERGRERGREKERERKRGRDLLSNSILLFAGYVHTKTANKNDSALRP